MKMAGIDVHKKVLMAVVMDTSTPQEKPVRRRFITLPNELHRFLTWLREQGVEEAVMESTAQYWRSVWLELEPHMRLHLAQAFSNRAARGRKHDFKDAERLVRRLIANELILSFVPNGEQRNWRSLTRMKVQLTRDRVRLQSQMECRLEEMRIKLSIVVCNLLGASGALTRWLSATARSAGMRHQTELAVAQVAGCSERDPSKQHRRKQFRGKLLKWHNLQWLQPEQ